MHTEFRYGKLKYISFVLIDIICLVISNLIALTIYSAGKDLTYNFNNHADVMIVMIIIDIVVTIIFSTLRRVLRWKKERELDESARHVFYCLIILGVFLFLTKSGADYSRATVLLAYAIDYVLIWFFRTSWRFLLQRWIKRSKKPTVFLFTTDAFLDEGKERLKDLGFDVKCSPAI